MSATPEQQAPGCFGAASTYSADSKVCQVCPAYQPCGGAAYERLQSLREIVNVKDLLAQHERARQRANMTTPAPSTPVEVSPIPVQAPAVIQKPLERTTQVVKVAFEVSVDDQKVIDMLGTRNGKTKEAAEILCKNNRVNDMRRQLPDGVNPFATSGPQYMRIICDMLIYGGLTKAGYKARLVKDLNWTDGTAGSHVAVACALLYSFGIMVPDLGDGFVVNPALSGDNKK